MRTFLAKSVPALAIIFVCVFGFTILAMGNACGYLEAVALEAQSYAWTACNTYGDASTECLNAQSDAGRCWGSIFQCRLQQ